MTLLARHAAARHHDQIVDLLSDSRTKRPYGYINADKVYAIDPMNENDVFEVGAANDPKSFTVPGIRDSGEPYHINLVRSFGEFQHRANIELSQSQTKSFVTQIRLLQLLTDGCDINFIGFVDYKSYTDAHSFRFSIELADAEDRLERYLLDYSTIEFLIQQGDFYSLENKFGKTDYYE